MAVVRDVGDRCPDRADGVLAGEAELFRTEQDRAGAQAAGRSGEGHRAQGGPGRVAGVDVDGAGEQDGVADEAGDPALMNRPTRGERRFAYWALFRFLAH